MNFFRGRPLSTVEERHSDDGSNRFSDTINSLRVPRQQEHYELEQRNVYPDIQEASERPESVCSNERETQSLPKGIFFMLFSWISPTMNRLNENREKYSDIEILEKDLETIITHKTCLAKERAERNHGIWNDKSNRTPALKLISFVFWRLFFATLFHFISIVSSFLTLVWALDHLFMYLAEVLNSGDRYQMDEIIETANLTTIEAVPSRDKNKVLAAQWLQFFIICELIRAFSTSITSIILIRSSIRLHQALSSAIYERIFELTKVPNEIPSPLSFQLKAIYTSIQAIPYVLGYGLTFALTIGYSFWVLGLSYFYTLCIFGVFIIFQALIPIQNGVFGEEGKKYKEQQFQHLDLIFENLRTFKLFSIEKFMNNKIFGLKQLEMFYVRGITFLHMMLMTLKMFRPLFLTIMSVVLIPGLFQQTVSIEYAFKLLIVNYWSIHLPKMFSHELSVLTKSRNEMNKLEKLFSEKNPSIPKELPETTNPKFCFEFSWPKRSGNEDLIPINLGMKYCVKSSKENFSRAFFALLLGDTNILKDQQQTLYRRGQIAYMPETPWILNDTIEANILCGQDFERKRFEKVLELCCMEELDQDREIDRESISAGEASKLSLARVLYTIADIYIIEELLSHLDIDSIEKISTNLSKDPEFMNKTVIYNSKNDQNFYFDGTEYIIFDENGKFVDVDDDDDDDDHGHDIAYPTTKSVYSLDLPEQYKQIKKDPVNKLATTLLSKKKMSLSFQSSMKKSQENKAVRKKDERKKVKLDEMEGVTVEDSLAESSIRTSVRSNRSVVETRHRGSNDADLTEMIPLQKNTVKPPKMYTSNSEAILYEFKQIWYIYIYHIIIAILYQLGNFTFQQKVSSQIYCFYFFSILFFHILMAYQFTKHSKARLERFYKLFLKQFFKTSLKFLEETPHGRLKMMFSSNFSKIEINVLKKINHIFFRAAGALVALFIIFFILLSPIQNIYGTIFKAPFLPRNFIGLLIYSITILYPFAVFAWMCRNFLKFKFCLDCLVTAEQNFGADLENFYNSTILGHDIIHINYYRKWQNEKQKNNVSKKMSFWWMKKFYKLSDKYQGANWLLESMTHWWNIRVDLWLIGYVMALWICGVYFLEEFGEAFAVLLIISALIINYFLQFFFTNSFRFFLDMGSFRQIANYRKLMKEYKENSNKKGHSTEDVSEYFKHPSVRFEHVYLKYQETENRYALRDLTFEIPKGKKVLITGPSGAGKTSIIAALFKLFSIERGNIRINNKSIEEADVYTFRSMMTVIPQNPVLFFKTIRENLDPDGIYKDEAMIYEALNDVGFKIDSTEKETSEVSNENSGSCINLDKELEDCPVEKVQALYLAKAILDQKPLIVMDEFPKWLPGAAKNTFGLIKEKFKEQTLIFVTHLKKERAPVDLSASQNDSLSSTFYKEIVIKNGKVDSENKFEQKEIPKELSSLS